MATVAQGIPDIAALLSDHKLFNDFIYTPFDEACAELWRRRDDGELKDRVVGLLHAGIPEPFLGKPRIVLLRYLITPNYEILRFLHLASEIENTRVLLCEFPQDKFVPSNTSKKLLGKLTFVMGRDRNGALKTESLRVIDFELATNKRIAEIRTTWGQLLPDFHHRFFVRMYPHLTLEKMYDISAWYAAHGPEAKKFYSPLLLLFIRHGILFENFVLGDKDELPFIRDIFLPAFIEVYALTGHKPLIIAAEPTDIEGSKFWLCYPPEGKKIVEEIAAARII